MYLVCRLLLAPATSWIYTLSLHDALPILSHSDTDAFDGASAVLFQVQLAFESVVDRLDQLPHRLEQGFCGLWDAAVAVGGPQQTDAAGGEDRKSTRLNSSHRCISYAVFCLLRPPPGSTLFPYTTLFRS